MRNIEIILHEMGGSLSELAKAVIYVRTDNDANMGKRVGSICRSDG